MSIDLEMVCLSTCIVNCSFLFVKNDVGLNATLRSAWPKGGIGGDWSSCSCGDRLEDKTFMILGASMFWLVFLMETFPVIATPDIAISGKEEDMEKFSS